LETKLLTFPENSNIISVRKVFEGKLCYRTMVS